MNKIDWKARIKSKVFWVTLIPALLMLAQTVAVPFGYKFDFANLGKQLTEIVNDVFVVLTILGIVIDPTTSGVSDQPRKGDK